MMQPWETDPDAWRGDEHPVDWPEEVYLAGEYGLFKHDAECGDHEKHRGELKMKWNDPLEGRHSSMQMKEWSNPPRFQMIPCSCTCGGSKAWVVLWKNGIQEMYGCICHNPLPANAVVVVETH